MRVEVSPNLISFFDSWKLKGIISNYRVDRDLRDGRADYSLIFSDGSKLELQNGLGGEFKFEPNIREMQVAPLQTTEQVVEQVDKPRRGRKANRIIYN